MKLSLQVLPTSGVHKQPQRLLSALWILGWLAIVALPGILKFLDKNDKFIIWIEKSTEFKDHPLPMLVSCLAAVFGPLFVLILHLKQKSEELTKEVSQLKESYAMLCLQSADLLNAVKDIAIRMIHFEKEPDLFSNFIGEFYALNAPLTWERHYLRKKAVNPIRVHIERYLNPSFESASYYYPIFAVLKTNIREQWAERIYEFFLILKRELREEAARRNLDPEEMLRKIKFWIPLRDKNTHKYEQEAHPATMTIFSGIRHEQHQVIFFHSTTMFSGAIELPEIAFLTHNQDFSKRVEKFCTHFENHAESLNMEKFLSELERIILDKARIAKIKVEVQAFECA